MICKKCGTNNKDTAKFCKNCGQQLAEEFAANNFEQETTSENDQKCCPSCGTVVKADALFCKKCGHRLDNSTTYPKNEELSDNKSMNDEEATIYIPVDESQGYSYKVNPDDAASKAYENNTGMNYNHTYTTEEELPEKFKPIGVWAYFGWTLLFLCVPFGWIVAIVFAVGSTENVNLKNFSKAICLFLLVTVAIIFLFFIFTSCTAGMLML